MYQSASSGKVYAFATSERGEMEQYEVRTSGDSVTGTKVRSFSVGSDTEGCVADDQLGHLYVNEERRGVWKYGAEPSTGSTRTQIDSVGSGNLRADVEGAAIYAEANGTGYLIVSSQGDSTFAVYERSGDNAYLGSFEVGGNGDAVSHTDGIDVTSAAVGPDYPLGLLVVHDASNPGAPTSNYKLVGWDQVAAALALSGGARELVEPTPEPTPTEPADPPIDGAAPDLPEETETEVSTKVLRTSSDEG